MKVLVVLSAVAALSAAQYNYAGFNAYNPYGTFYNGVPSAYGLNLRSYAPAAVYGSQYHAQDNFGGYQYGYADGLSNKLETRRADGSTAGSYSYVDTNGQTQTVRYTAGAGGFQVEGTNLPVAPKPVQDTPEVAKARAEFQAAFQAAASRQRRSAPRPVQDTPEVAAEKAKFRALFAQSAAAAAAGATPVASYLADTAEVAAEKARFHAAYNAAAARAAAPAVPVAAPAPFPYTGLPYSATPFNGFYNGQYNGFYNNYFNGFNRFFY